MRLFWTPKARRDLNGIIDYILQENPRAALRVANRIEQLASMLLAHPGMGRPGRVETTRELVLSDLPYILPYIVEGETITILGVLHTAMRWPEHLQITS
jgi:toxin ParE1/3/4